MFNITTFVVAFVVLFGSISPALAQAPDGELRFFNSQDEEVPFEQLSAEEQAYFNKLEEQEAAAGGNA